MITQDIYNQAPANSIATDIDTPQTKTVNEKYANSYLHQPFPAAKPGKDDLSRIHKANQKLTKQLAKKETSLNPLPRHKTLREKIKENWTFA